MSLSEGNKAPGFRLQNSNGEEVSLSSFRGKKNVVLLFFPLAFSGTCTEELCKTRDNMKLYNELDAEVIAISIDSFYVLREFKKSNNFNFTLLSDFNREAAEKYDVIYEDFYGLKGVAKRSAFVIDREGIIRYCEILEDADLLPDFNRIRSVLSRLG